MSDRDDSALMTDATLTKEPIDPTDRNEPIAAIDATLPTEPTDRIELVLAMLRIDPSERHDRIDGRGDSIIRTYRGAPAAARSAQLGQTTACSSL